VTEGFLPLREWVCGHIASFAGFRPTSEQVLITTGSQQALDLMARAFVDPGDTVLAENPAYFGAIQAFRAAETKLVGVASDAQGMLPGALEEAIQSACTPVKLLYLVPNFQNPTGATMTMERRREIAHVAARFDLPIFEDDPYGRLRFSGEEIPAICSLPEAGTATYLGTSSKILAPGLRVAWLVVRDPSLFEKIVPLKQASDLHTSAFTQQIVHGFVSDTTRFGSHLSALIAAYRERRDAMLAALGDHMPEGCTWTRPDGGMFLWVTLPESIDATHLLQHARAHKIAFVPGEPFWLDAPKRNTLRLNFSHTPAAKTGVGIARLAALIRGCS